MTAAQPGGTVTTVAAAANSLLGGPVSRDGAREEARRELSKNVYTEGRPGWFESTVDWIDDRISNLWEWVVPDPSAGVGGFKGLGVLAFVLVLVVLLIVVRLWLGPVRRTARDTTTEGELSGPLTAAELRDLSRDEAARGDHANAVRSRLRAVARMLEERALLDPKPGRTARELISDLRGVAPRTGGLVSDGGSDDPIAALTAAVDVFSEIWYGGRPATAQAYEIVVRADDVLGALRRRAGRAPADDDSFVVPV